MKSILLFSLIALISCGDFGEKALNIFICISKNEKIIKEAVNIINSFKTKDFPTIVSTAINCY